MVEPRRRGPGPRPGQRPSAVARVFVGFRMHPDGLRLADELAVETGRSRSEVLRAALRLVFNDRHMVERLRALLRR